MSAPSSSLEPFIRELPKVELHIHLEGSVRPDTLRKLVRRKGRLAKETDEWIRERARQSFLYANFQEFIDAFKFVATLLETPEDYALATTDLLEDLSAQNVRYTEIVLSAGVVLWKKQPLEAVFRAVSAAAKEAESRLGLGVNWIFDAVRQFGCEHAREVLEFAARFRSQGVVAFGIGGDEAQGPAELFADVYREARDQGLHTTAHAGETAGPESVRNAVELLGAERIAHGFSAARDSSVMALLRERGIPLEVCLTSNVATGVVGCVEGHPLPTFLESGLVVTLNSDDPGLFDTSLEGEFLLASEHFALSAKQITRLCGNAVRAAFLPWEAKQSLLEELSRASEKAASA